jgi:hypothetical protein
VDTNRAPICPNEGFPMVSTIVGWRCPICGLACLPVPRVDRSAAVVARPFAGHLAGRPGGARSTPRGS